MLCGWATDIGMRRSQNQDSAGAYAEDGLFIVCDGMGGHRGGEIASSMAVQIISESMLKDRPRSRAHPRDVIHESLLKANQEIFLRSSREPALNNMGTTATFLYCLEKKALIAHVGDSRCYLLRPEGIWQLTRDHSLVQEKLRAGMITREQLKTDRMKNVITRSVGFDTASPVDIYEYEPKDGDLFLLCSDGLSGPLDDVTLHRLVYENLPAYTQESLQECVKILIQQANDRGGDDNITALLVAWKQGT